MTHQDLMRSLTVERHHQQPRLTREEQQLDDLRQVIHVLAMALTEGKSVA